jgi:uncharacterized membrane protein
MRQHPFDYVPEKKRTVPAWAKCPEFGTNCVTLAGLKKMLSKQIKLFGVNLAVSAQRITNKIRILLQVLKVLRSFSNKSFLDSTQNLLSERIFTNCFES